MDSVVDGNANAFRTWYHILRELPSTMFVLTTFLSGTGAAKKKESSL